MRQVIASRQAVRRPSSMAQLGKHKQVSFAGKEGMEARTPGESPGSLISVCQCLARLGFM